MQLPARLGKYELQQLLGGGMSKVYRAYDTVIGRTVAVKILTDEAAQDTDSRERFLDEARTAAKVKHENVISIYDFGADPEKGLFMVMEFLQGEDLRSAIKGGRTGDLQNKLKIALQAARALDFIHQNRIIHRDVKPENLHLDAKGLVKLMDFGIAKSEDLSRTQPGFALGTPYYMAPEQVRGEKLTAQADVYAFGVMVFELLTGRKPIVADSVNAIFAAILNAPIDLAPLREAGMPQPLIDVVVRCTAKNPAERPQGLGPVVADLERLMTAAAPPPPAAPKPVHVEPVAEQRSKTPLIAGIAVALVVAAGGAYIALKPSTPKPPAELARTLTTPTGTMVLVPAGEFKFGRDKQPVTTPAYYIDQTEVSNAAYRQFCDATGHAQPDGLAAAHADFPVVNVTIADARDFAKWAGKRLPTDVEWEKAARGTDGRRFPWGDSGEVSRANVGTREIQAVNSFHSGASPYDVLQAVGNVWEIVDKVRPAPANLARFQKMNPPPTSAQPWYMIRGQSAAEPLLDDVIWDSTGIPEGFRDLFIGFRCVKDVK